MEYEPIALVPIHASHYAPSYKILHGIALFRTVRKGKPPPPPALWVRYHRRLVLLYSAHYIPTKKTHLLHLHTASYKPSNIHTLKHLMGGTPFIYSALAV